MKLPARQSKTEALVEWGLPLLLALVTLLLVVLVGCGKASAPATSQGINKAAVSQKGVDEIASRYKDITKEGDDLETPVQPGVIDRVQALAPESYRISGSSIPEQELKIIISSCTKSFEANATSTEVFKKGLPYCVCMAKKLQTDLSYEDYRAMHIAAKKKEAMAEDTAKQLAGFTITCLHDVGLQTKYD